MSEILNYLKSLGIDYDLYEHPPIHRVGDDKGLDLKIPGCQTKNLFLKDKKSKQFYLVCMSQNSKMDLKDFGKKLGGMKFSYGKAEDLKMLLNVEPGSVSIFGLIFDVEKNVNLIIDKVLIESDFVAFHPNNNTQTIVISSDDLKKFLSGFGNTIYDFINT